MHVHPIVVGVQRPLIVFHKREFARLLTNRRTSKTNSNRFLGSLPTIFISYLNGNCFAGSNNVCLCAAEKVVGENITDIRIENERADISYEPCGFLSKS